MSIHPQIIEKEGKKEFVVIPYEEFLEIQEIMDDYQDLKDLREAKAESDNSSIDLALIRSELLKD